MPTDAAAGEYLLQIEDPLRQQDERGNPFLAYAGKHVVSAYEAGRLAGMEQAAVILDAIAEYGAATAIRAAKEGA